MPFGIVAAAIGDTVAAAGLTGLAATAATDAIGGALLGGGIGGIEGLVTGGNIGQDALHGAEGGALTGGLGGVGGALGGIGGATLGGAAGGALGGLVTGGNVGLDAAIGGVGSGINAGINGASLTGAPPNPGASVAGGGGGPGAGAGGTAPPPGVTATPDATSVGNDVAVQAPGGNTFAAVGPEPASQFNAPATPLSDGSSLNSTLSQLPQTSGATGNASAPLASPSFNAPSGGGAPIAPGGADTGSGGLDSLVNSFNQSNQSLPTQGLNAITGGQSALPNIGVPNEANPSTLTADLNAASPGGSSALAADAGGGTGGGSSGGSNAGGFMSKSPISGALNAFGQGNIGTGIADLAPLAIPGAGLAFEAIRGNQALKGEKNIEAIAGQEQAQGQTMENYLQTGTLPSGLQSAVTQAGDAAKAAIRQQYASHGMSGSSAEEQALSSVDQSVQVNGANMALQLLNTGISETGMASSLYTQIMNDALQQDQALGGALTAFGTAAAGGTPGINLSGLLGKGGTAVPVS